MVTAAITPTAHTLTASKKDATHWDSRNRGNTGFKAATNTNDGKKIAPAATSAHDNLPPLTRYPMNAAVDNTGPGVN